MTPSTVTCSAKRPWSFYPAGQLSQISGTQAAQARSDLDLLIKQAEMQWAAQN